MILTSISLENFRSYTQSEFQFEASGSLIIGPNGSGKTNLLEAVAYTGIGKSVRYHRDDDLLQLNAGYFRIKASFISESQDPLSICLSYGNGKKLLKIDELPVRQLSKLFDIAKIIYCAPEDLQLINGSPRFRRQYFDLATAQLHPTYIPVLREYLHVVEQRNALLKTKFSPAEKKVWDERFVETWYEVLSYRKRYLHLVNEFLQADFAKLFSLSSALELGYQHAHRQKPQETKDDLLSALQDLEHRELLLQRSQAGAHLDDYEFLMQQQLMKSFASQGQKRVAVILLKLVQARLIEQVTHIKPVLLFDDILAELDSKHSHIIKQCVDSRYQVFIASPREDVKQIWSVHPELRLTGGKLEA